MQHQAESAGHASDKAPTGIPGLDDITNGGLLRGRTTLLLGATGTGKTVLAMEFLVHGAVDYDEPGLFIGLEETPEELAGDFATMGFDLGSLVESGKLTVDHVAIPPDVIEIGEYDLEGLLIRLDGHVGRTGARRVVLDGLAALFTGFTNASAVRRALLKLVRWLKGKGLSIVVTAEADTEFVRLGLGRTLSDCIIRLRQEAEDGITTRYLQILKLRGSDHQLDEHPFLIGESGISVLPLSAVDLDYSVPSERISTGVQQLDIMLGGGYYQGSAILVTGEPGTGKSSLAAHFVDRACAREERCVYFAFEESPGQVIRNMRSIGIDLEPWAHQGLLKIRALRPSKYGLEGHLLGMERVLAAFQPLVVVVDPLSALRDGPSLHLVKSMTSRLVDFLKSRSITALFTSMVQEDTAEIGISTLMDTWIVLRNMEYAGEKTRLLHILKSRGMAHSNEVREFLFTDKGVQLVEVYIGPEGAVTGKKRELQEMADSLAVQGIGVEMENRSREFETKRRSLEAKIASLRAEIETEEQALKMAMERLQLEQRKVSTQTKMMPQDLGREVSSDGPG